MNILWLVRDFVACEIVKQQTDFAILAFEIAVKHLDPSVTE
jgi:hypothetical protein